MASALLGMEPPELPVAQLVRLTGLFGISENRARVALSRMVAAGTTIDYDGSWWLAVVTTSGSTAEVRGARRRALAYARLAELREGVWMRPANVAVPLPASLDADVQLMTAFPPDAALLAARLWDLAGWAALATRLLAALQAGVPDGPEALAPGFELSAAVLRHLQADPLLPAPLQPADWPGTRLRETYDEWDARYRRTLNAWSRAG